MDRSSALDSAFLQIESAQTSLHIASLAIFEGPIPPQHEIVAALTRKLPLAPRLRQRLLTVPFALGRPVWADDPDFAIGNHLRRVAAAAPGDEDDLREVVDAVLSEPLDHERPLWEDVVIEGLAGGRWALVTKVHHAMVDGIAGTDLFTTMLDTSAGADPAAVSAAADQPPWRPDQPPGLIRLAADAIREQAALRARELRSVPRALRRTRHPQALVEAAVETGGGLLAFARAAVPTAPSSLVGPLGRNREFRWTEVALADVLVVHDQLGCTINDVVLAAVTRAFRGLLIARGEEPHPHAVRCLVPVSVRPPANKGTLDNEVSALLATLPVELEDPLERLTEVAVRMRALKESHEARAGERVIALADALPPPALAAFLHLAFRAPHRHLTTVTTNVPGPPSRLYLAGRPLLATYPYVPIADRLRIGVAVTSYEGRLLFGITADRDSTPDAAVLVRNLDAGFSELLERALQHRGTGRGDR